MGICRLLSFLVLAFGTGLAAQTYPLAQQSPAAWSSVSFASIRGYHFRCVASNITVTQLGCWYPDSSTTGKYVTLWNWSTQAQLGQVLTTAGTGWRFTNLATPVTLQANTEYVVVGYSLTGHYFNNGVPSSWMPSSPIQYIDMAYKNSPTGKDDFPNGGVLTTSHHGVVDFGYTTGATLNVSATAGSTQTVYANHTGTGGNGFSVGQFTITNTSPTQSGTLTGILVQGAGTGNHTSAYADFRIFRETGTVGGFDSGTDQIVGSGTFAGSPAQTTVNVSGGEQTFNSSQAKTYYLVARLNGSATPSQTFTFTINDITVGATTTKSGVPSGTMNGFSILAPSFAFADASPAAAGNAYLGGVDYLIQKFTVSYPNGPDNTLTGIPVQSSGNGNDMNPASRA